MQHWYQVGGRSWDNVRPAGRGNVEAGGCWGNVEPGDGKGSADAEAGRRGREHTRGNKDVGAQAAADDGRVGDVSPRGLAVVGRGLTRGRI